MSWESRGIGYDQIDFSSVTGIPANPIQQKAVPDQPLRYSYNPSVENAIYSRHHSSMPKVPEKVIHEIQHKPEPSQPSCKECNYYKQVLDRQQKIMVFLFLIIMIVIIAITNNHTNQLLSAIRPNTQT